MRRKLFEDICNDPARIYRAPADVLRDRRFGDEERLEILRAWRDADPQYESEIAAILAELETRLSAVRHHAAE